ncbi:MAG: HPr family phosphocarrier protein [Lachnospiraceae bacterium]|nr:HPr family phosphocarrier protein [Lachnospiraceae bacterium]
MQRFNHVLEISEGIHARPAMALANMARMLDSKITVAHGERKANAKNMPALLALRAFQGDQVTFMVEGETEEEDTQKLKEFCDFNL